MEYTAPTRGENFAAGGSPAPSVSPSEPDLRVVRSTGVDPERAVAHAGEIDEVDVEAAVGSNCSGLFNGTPASRNAMTVTTVANTRSTKIANTKRI